VPETPGVWEESWHVLSGQLDITRVIVHTVSGPAFCGPTGAGYAYSRAAGVAARGARSKDNVGSSERGADDDH
jgi:hypothetical protein